METQRELLKTLSRNQIDRVKLLSNLKKYKVIFDEESSYIILKYRLKLKLIENITTCVSDDNEIANFARMKKETEDFLDFQNEKLAKEKFKCCLAGCLFECKEHRYYMRHLQRVHPKESHLSCKYGLKCRRAFTTLALLKDHIIQAHVKKPSSSEEPISALPVDVPCKCSISKCGGAQFSSVKILMLHLRNYHAKAGEMVTCIFESCTSKYDNAGTLRNHFLNKHTKDGSYNLKPSNKLHCDLPISQTADVFHASDDVQDSDANLDAEAEEEDLYSHQEHDIAVDLQDRGETEDIDEVFMMAYCDFLNKLTNFQFIPQSSIQLISEEYLKNYKKSNEAKMTALRKSLMKNIPGISEADIRRVMADVDENDAFLGAQLSLDSEHKRINYLKDNFTYVEPKEIIFNPKQVKESKAPKAVMHYVPLIQTVKNLVQDSTFLDVTESNFSNNPDSVLRDVKDGIMFKTNPFFIENPEALTLLLYSDGVELVNPIGAGRGKHKVIQIFLTFGEIPKIQRSKIDRIQLVAVVKEKVVKQFGFKKVYHQIVEDLKELEKGVTVFHPVQRLVKCGLLLHPADNLEAHAVGGFSQSFSSRDICRFCHIQYDDLQENIHDYGSKQHNKWTKEEYDRAANAAEKKIATDDINYVDDDSSDNEVEETEEEVSYREDDEVLELYGVKHRCPLNSLQAFHSTSGFPPDILHDVFEGVVSQDLLGIIRILKSKGWFSIQEYNMNLNSLKYKSNEASDKPQNIPESMKVKKLVGKAVSNWTHIRNFPLLIRKFVQNKDEPALVLGLQLHELVERITAPEFREFEISVLEDRIIEYLDYRQELYCEYSTLLGSAKPKTHHLTHYPEAIANFGPPMNYWTARYESRHRIAKSTAESAKKNISYTLATRQQMRLSSVYYHGMFDTVELIVSDKVAYKRSLKGKTDLEKSILPFMREQDFLCTELLFRSQKYKVGDLVVMQSYSQDELKIGLILSMLIREDSVLFVVKQYIARRSWLRFFKADSDDPVLSIFDAKHLADYKPLNNHGTSSQLFFCLHHHISSSFD